MDELDEPDEIEALGFPDFLSDNRDDLLAFALELREVARKLLQEKERLRDKLWVFGMCPDCEHVNYCVCGAHNED